MLVAIIIVISFGVIIALVARGVRHALYFLRPSMRNHYIIANLAAFSLASIAVSGAASFYLLEVYDRRISGTDLGQPPPASPVADFVLIVPPKVKKDEQFPVYARMNLHLTAEQVKKDLIEQGRRDFEYKVIVEAVRTENVMAAELSGGKLFEIEPKGLQRRDFGSSGEADWAWHVTPLKGGEHYLMVTVYAMASPGDASPPKYFRAKEAKIMVEVSTLERATELLGEVSAPATSAQLLWTTIILPIGGGAIFLYRRRKKRIKKKPKPQGKKSPRR
ncbi:hypothetical protein [Azospirillum brasilense]|uniref:hypothetical protein n=1 Tax=Azospirillum brasilense TaxID=192 RepID=UPI0013B442FC|nr:hypothetical protein [Azospirillum brasilense]